LPRVSVRPVIVERIVGELEGEAEVEAIGAQGGAPLRIGAAHTAPASAAAAKSSAVLEVMIFQIDRLRELEIMGAG